MMNSPLYSEDEVEHLKKYAHDMLYDLLNIQYALVHGAGFSDVESLKTIEKLYFVQRFIEEQNQEKQALKRGK